MPKTITNEDGTEETFFSQEELDAAAAEKAKEVEDSKTAELKAKEDELTKLKNKEMNFEKLRQKTEKEEGEKGELSKQIQSLSSEIAEIRSAPLKSAVEGFITEQIGENKEDQDLFNSYFERIGKDAKTTKEVEQALQDTLALYQSKKPKANPDSQMLQTGVDQGMGIDPDKETEASKAIGNALGISAKDKKTYGKGIKLS